MKTIPKNIKLETKRLVLKPLWNTNPKTMQKQANNFTIANFIGPDFHHPYKLKNATGFIQSSKDNWNKKGKEWVFAIFTKENNIYIGNIGIKYDEINNTISNLGYWIGEDFWGNGYMSEAVEEICKYSFKILKVRKIIAKVFSPNKASQKVLIKSGFEIEGILKKSHILKDKKIVDEIVFGKFSK
ncbi:MAG: GNAT family N-acetyltransferase [Candidatus Nomurabacteria bacterium]